MKAVAVLIAVLLGFNLLVGCSKLPVGKYVGNGGYIELKSDGTCYAQGNAGGLAGKCTTDGDTILFKTDGGLAQKFKLKDDKLINESNGETFVKQR